MLNNSFFYFFTLSLFKNRKRYFAIVAISTLVIFLLSSVLFLSDSIKYSIDSQLELEPDLIVQKRLGGRVVPLDESIVDKIAEIYGVSQVTKRVYGRYYFDKEYSALIFGVDFLDEQSSKALAKLLNREDLKRFLSSESMLVGEGVFNYLKSHFYPKAYNFLTPSGKIKSVKILKVLDRRSNLFSNNLIILPQELAKEILGLKADEISDIALNVPNPDEEANIQTKLEGLFLNAFISGKKEMQKEYENLFNYKGGLFLALYLIVIMTLSLILYQRYSLANSLEKREVAILRSLGWSIKDVLGLKALENIMLVLFSFIVGLFLGYLYVFILKAPLLSELFLGKNLQTQIEFLPHINYLSLATIFILYATTFLSAVLIPVWRVATTEPKEALS